MSFSSVSAISGLSVAAIALFTSNAVRAQATEPSSTQATNAPAAREAAQTSGTLEEIVVTAQLREQSLQEVPAAVTAVDGELLVQRGMTTLTQVTQLAPALRIAPLRSQTFIFLRGVGQALSAPNADPQVAVNVNGVYLPSEMSNTAFFDVERIEVVPGPQGTLYGRNSTGGVINLFTRRPGDETAVNGFVEYGNYNRTQALLGADVSLSDSFAIRATATYNSHDGFYSNGLDAPETYGGRLTAVWRPDAATTVTAILSDVHDGGEPGTTQLNPSRTGDPRRMDFDPDSIGSDADARTSTASLEVNRDLGETQRLTYIGGYNDFDSLVFGSFFPRSVGDTDVPVPIVNDQRNESTSHELRLNGSWDRLETVLGAYYFWNESYYSVLQNTFPALVTVTDQNMVAESEGHAVFGQATYSVLDSLRLTGGVRYSYTEKSLTGENAQPQAGISRPFEGEGSEDRIDWRVGAEFDVAPDSMLYANVQTGFTPGGFSSDALSLSSTEAKQFDTVELLAYSAGLKSRLLDGMLTTNLEGFYYDYTDFQVSARDPATLIVNVYNAQEAEIYGAQLETDLRITPDVRLSLGVGYLDATATRLVLPPGVTTPGPGGVPISDLSGFDLPFAPDWTVNASYQHTFPLSSGAELEFLASTQYASSQWQIFNHAPNSQQEEKTRSDVSLTYRGANGHWSVSAWVRNLEDSTVLLFGAGPVGGPPVFPSTFQLDAPRTYGGRVTFDF